jgi:hypothetical protein
MIPFLSPSNFCHNPNNSFPVEVMKKLAAWTQLLAHFQVPETSVGRYRAKFSSIEKIYRKNKLSFSFT